jgi:hypothetical protein
MTAAAAKSRGASVVAALLACGIGAGLCPGQTRPASRAATAPTSRAAATTAATTAPPAELEPLVARLGAQAWTTREEAQRKILALGPDAAEARIRELARRATDPEVQQRAQIILTQFELARLRAERARTRADDGASLITLHAKALPLREVYASVFKQARARLTVWPPDLLDHEGDRPVTADFEKVPFWEAVGELEEQTGLSIGRGGRGPSLVRSRDAGGRARPAETSVNGPYKVVAEPRFGNGLRQFSVYLEPGMRLLRYSRFPVIEAAADAQGKPVILPNAAALNARAGMADVWGGGSSNPFQVMVPNAPRDLAYLKGTVRATLATRVQTIEFDNIAAANNVEKKLDGRRFLYNCMVPEPGEYLITLVAYNTVPPTPGLQQTHVTLVDAAGNEVLGGGGGSSTSATRVEFQMSFRQGRKTGPAAKLVLEVPVESRDVTIPFELGDPPAAAAPMPQGAGGAWHEQPGRALRGPRHPMADEK